MTAKESLWLHWYDQSKGNHSEVGGLYFYGYWARKPMPVLPVNQFIALWPDRSIESRIHNWGEEYSVSSVEVRILSYPLAADWSRLIDASLAWFIGQGAVVSWCGNELCSQSIEAIDPGGGDGLVYAGYSKPTGTLCLSGLDDEIVYLGEAECDALRKSVEFPAAS